YKPSGISYKPSGIDYGASGISYPKVPKKEAPMSSPILQPKITKPPVKPPAKKWKGKPHYIKTEKTMQILKQPFQYQPSFTASVFKIRGKSKKLGRIGYNPLQIRGLVNGKRKKKKIKII
ncbi:MAG: hypothetical protein ACOC5T_08265, partial [Elusimicrobiota bacterium]